MLFSFYCVCVWHLNSCTIVVYLVCAVLLYFRLHDSDTNAVIYRYEVSRIIFYFRGPTGSPDQACFAFTFQTGEANELSPLFHCHIFRCNIPEAVNQVSSKFNEIVFFNWIKSLIDFFIVQVVFRRHFNRQYQPA